MEQRWGRYVPSKDERRALRRLVKRGRAGLTARELADNEAAGMLAGITLVWHGLAVVTRGNRFMAPQHAGKAVPDAIIWDDDGRAGRVPSPQG